MARGGVLCEGLRGNECETQKDGDAELTGWHGESSFRDGHEGFLGSASVIWSRRHPGGHNLVPRSPTLTVIEPNTSSECW